MKEGLRYDFHNLLRRIHPTSQPASQPIQPYLLHATRLLSSHTDGEPMHMYILFAYYYMHNINRKNTGDSRPIKEGIINLEKGIRM